MTEEIKFLDLFGGIGGFRLGLENTSNKFKCVDYIEKDKYAVKSYNEIFNEQHDPKDATEIQPENLPEFNILCAGFPCQSFSIAGNRGGFDDTRGTLFFEIARITREKLPEILFLENVKGLLNHSDGETFIKIIETLDELGYDLQWQVLNSKYHGVPQNRERVFIIGHRRDLPRPEVFPFREPNQRTTGESEKQVITRPCLTGAIGRGGSSSEYIRSLKKVNQADQEKRGDIECINPESSHHFRIYEKYGISPTLLSSTGGGSTKHPYIIERTGEMETIVPNRPESRPSVSEEGQSGGSGILYNNNYSYALSSSPHYITDYGKLPNWVDTLEDVNNTVREGGRGSFKKKDNWDLIYDDVRIRKLTPRECWRLQGFPDWAFDRASEVNSDTQLYKQAGNSVTVNVIEDIGKRLLDYYENKRYQAEEGSQ